MLDPLHLDAIALALIGHDVAVLTDADLTRPTPCAGWTVADLLTHMNERHEAVIASVLPPPTVSAADARAAFAHSAARWVVAMEQAGPEIRLPSSGTVATGQVLSIHFVDMLTHRWDLARALDRPCPVPEHLTTAALPIARAITVPGGPLTGPGGAYAPRLTEDVNRPTLDNIVALLGRDPAWTGPSTTSARPSMT
ncbi:TIGR03086 family metal-binding protein [Nocardia sp. AG03]|uniref:TIGR03086 family metal-binding protein n=1 Tax=Nocardia sp. AG03 TaxID=3025312 RepID=UPI002418247D|nr:TIGR03086 family metal-binding protein [Nocardia sp. AG03]